MSVLIRGMEMPTDCLKCPFCLFADGYWKCLVDGSHADFGGTCWPQNCPLVPVPPHERLIDADVLYEDCALDHDYDVMATTTRINEYMQLKIDGAPTIIPAEEEKDGQQAAD